MPGLGAASDNEMCRILRVGMSLPPSDAEVDQISRDHILAEHYNAGFRLLRAQAWMVRDYLKYGAALGHVPVGGGKTLTTLLLAQLAHRKGKERILLFVPAQVRTQLIHADIPWARKRINITTPIVDLGDQTRNQRHRQAGKERGLFIMPYSLLSGRDGAELLDEIDPHVIIADEAHSVRSRTAARTKRFLKWVNNKDIEFIPMSGTLTSKSVRDYHHLTILALRDGAPIPLHSMAAKEWGDVLDSEASPNEFQLRTLEPLRSWARGSLAGDYPPTIEGSRRAFEVRFNSAPGVIKDSTGIGTSLAFCNDELVPPADYPGWTKCQELIDQVQNLWLTPNGDEIDFGIHIYKWVEELSAGFYHRLAWPTDLEPDVLRRAIEHHDFSQSYHRLLRAFLKDGCQKGLDTPFLVGQDMVRNQDKHVGERLYASWKRMKEAAWKGMPERLSTPVPICDYKVAAAAAWAGAFPKNAGMILWVHHQAIGRWLVELLKRGPRGDEVLWAPSEAEKPGINMELLDLSNAGKIVVASISAHGTGKNLQHFQDSLFVQFPRDAKTAEQTVGRIHRTGQAADHLDVMTIRSTWHDHISFAACLNDSLYIQQTTGIRMKVLYAEHDPLPRIYSPSFLAAQGLQNELLSSKMQDEMQERFGGFSDSRQR